MPKMRSKPEEIIGKLRHADVLLGQGKHVAEVAKARLTRPARQLVHPNCSSKTPTYSSIGPARPAMAEPTDRPQTFLGLMGLRVSAPTSRSPALLPFLPLLRSRHQVAGPQTLSLLAPSPAFWYTSLTIYGDPRIAARPEDRMQLCTPDLQTVIISNRCSGGSLEQVSADSCERVGICYRVA
jgi:hypothetical protein